MLARFDRWFPVALTATFATMTASLAMIFFYAPVESTMGIVQKIFYTHVPAAMAAYGGFTIAAIASFLYLVRPARRWDIAARSGAEIGLLFCVYVLVSGPLWAAKAWGKPWVWDPQLTATFVLFLLYGGYVMLRSLSGGGERVRKIAAVLAVFAFVDIPIIHYSVRRWGGYHPVVEREGGGGLAPAMSHTLTVSMIAFLLLLGVMVWMLVRMRSTAHAIDELYVDLEDASMLLER